MIFGLGKLVPDSVKFRAWRKWKNVFFRAHTHLGRSKHLLEVYKIFRVNQELIVTPYTQLVIEGAARTATTFAYYNMLVSQPLTFSIAYHIHLPAQVIRALELKIPVLVTIRNPRDAVASAVVRENFMSTKAYLERYLIFYRTLEPRMGEFVVADFSEIVSDFPAIIKRLNSTFGCGYTIPDDLPRLNAEVAECLDRHHQCYGGGPNQSYRPNSIKKLAKAKVEFVSQQALLDRCEDIYNHYLSRLSDVAISSNSDADTMNNA